MSSQLLYSIDSSLHYYAGNPPPRGQLSVVVCACKALVRLQDAQSHVRPSAWLQKVVREFSPGYRSTLTLGACWHGQETMPRPETAFRLAGPQASRASRKCPPRMCEHIPRPWSQKRGTTRSSPSKAPDGPSSSAPPGWQDSALGWRPGPHLGRSDSVEPQGWPLASQIGMSLGHAHWLGPVASLSA